MRELDARRARGPDLLPVPRAAPPADLARQAPASSSGSRRRCGRAGGSPGTCSSSTTHIAAEMDGEWEEHAGIKNRVTHVPADNRIDLELDRARTVSLWWATRSEWEGLVEVAGLEVEALYGGFDARAVRRAEHTSSYGSHGSPRERCTTRSRGSTTRGAAASSRTSRSTSTRRSGPAAPVVELGVGTGRIAVPTAAAGDLGDRRRLVARGCSRSARGGRAGRRRGAARPAARRPDAAAGRRARAPRHLSLPVVPAPARRRGAAARRSSRRASCSFPAAGSSSTSSLPGPTTSRTRTAAGSSASRGSSSARTGIPGRER